MKPEISITEKHLVKSSTLFPIILSDEMALNILN